MGTIRNTFLAVSLWFLTCLFAVQALFSVIRLIKNRALIFGVSCAVFAAALALFSVGDPRLPYNIDSALYYQLFYVIGYVSVDAVNRLLYPRKTAGNVGMLLGGLVLGAYALLFFLGWDVLKGCYGIMVLGSLAEVVSALLLIGFTILAARAMERVEPLQNVGRNTLYLCGSEYILHTLAACAAGLLGLEITISNPTAAILYSAFLLWIGNRWLVPVERRVLAWIYAVPGRIAQAHTRRTDSVHFNAGSR